MPFNRILSATAQRHLYATHTRMERAINRISSGQRINHARDDPAGISVSGRFRAQISSMIEAQRNANYNINLLNTAEGALSTIDEIISRMRSLAVQASNGTLDTADREALNIEFQQFKSEIERIAQTTNYNGIKLLDGSNSITEAISATLPAAHIETHQGVDLDTKFKKDKVLEFTYAGNTYSITTQKDDTVQDIADKINDLGIGVTATVQTTGNTGYLTLTGQPGEGNDIEIISSNIESGGVIYFTPDEWDTTQAAADESTGNLGIIFHIGTGTVSNNDYYHVGLLNMTVSALSLTSAALTSAQLAGAAINTIDTANTSKDDEYTRLGALVERLKNSITNLKIGSENTVKSEANIRDADIALEMTELVRAKILMESGAAMLSQANLIPALINRLIG